MRILLVNKYHYIRGGSETYYFGLADLLRKAGHEVFFFSMQDERNIPCDESDYFVSNIEFNGELSASQKVKAGLRMVYSIEAKRKIEKLIIDKKPDIVHINLFHRVMTASIVDAAKKHGIPVVFTMHDLNCICPNHTMLDHGEICEDCLKGNYNNCVKRVCFKDSRMKCLMAAIESEYNKLSGLYKKIDLFITPSEFYRNKMMESGLTKSPVICLRNFLPADTVFAPYYEHEGYFLYFGRLTIEKGVRTILKAVELAQGIKLKVAGTGEDEAFLHNYVKNNQIINQVEFLGFLSGEKLKETVQKAKCILLPSEWYENGPYSIMEAMAAGKPVIVSDMGGLPEIVKNGENGFISKAFDINSLADCILKVDNLCEKEYRVMSENSVNKAKIWFDASKYMKDLEVLYSELVQRYRR